MNQASVYRWSDVSVDHPTDLIERSRVVGEKMMIAKVTLHKGFRVVPHEHPNEQFALVISGRVRFEVFDSGVSEPRVVELVADELLHLPGGVRHGAEAIETSVVLDLFSPPSERTGVDQQRDQ